MSYFKKSLLFLAAIAALVVIATLVAVATGKNIDDIQVLSGSLVATLRPWRWFLLICLAIFWHHLVDLLGKIKRLDDEQIAYGKSVRWRLMAYFILFELLVIENLPAKIYGAI